MPDQRGHAPVPGESDQHHHHHHLTEQAGHVAEHAAEHAAERAGKGGFAAAVAAEFDLKKVIGGPRGVVESVLPYTVFSIAFAITKDVRTSVYAALVPLAVLIVWRLIAREPLTQAIGGVFGILLGAFVSRQTGRASDVFLISIVKNGGSALLGMASIAVRWPIVGVFVGPLTGENFTWRRHPARYRAYVLATWIWVGMFLIRVAVQVPLSLNDQTVLLGLLNGLVLGIPLFAAAIWLIWLVLRAVPTIKITDGAEPVAGSTSSSS
ncbi:DUF3159 domain-containing protein [Kineosporia sp. J2-2]|uniref:DUF3159 domain-containing protein n=1 Tax=Kineosporia corallincola TaxID=2835133 RepID=A0ABS5TDM7_9ACTN|nr:DUF3159 domain-containing protein [Kineosporia corallincola]MBT0769200.1 DUF3159 domain-containing protein [Kineosporia corallincola]